MGRSMAAIEKVLAEDTSPLAAVLGRYSVEITSRDVRALEDVRSILPKGTEVFVASLPGESRDVLVEAAAAISAAGLSPVPHIVARNIARLDELDGTLARLAGEAGVRRVLTLGGDRDKPEGALDQSLQIVESGLIEKHGIREIAIACYPEGHPRIPDDKLDEARAAKLAAASKAGLEVTLVSQFVFDPAPVVSFAKRIRAAGVEAPLRVGVAGPASRTKLIKYALRCGVGPSLRALRERGELAQSVMAGETPHDLLTEVAAAQDAEPALGIEGTHFFTFGDPARSVRWAEEQRGA